ncbi:ankyrin repeat domain-containing protein 34B-like [Solea senegalensis]|uniref:Ankyrin repeat domain-containing protein 34B-like n=1 Tax=Solea senegalensis TaxID=28829 RepID=A0AAV6QHZ2_SOLSE|nr:ankyrin repeat domain 34Bb [Solea senegalensis]KAG7490135.1 ankyrin repeat domain-containing protein 34B-like [Solea senegalensis]
MDESTKVQTDGNSLLKAVCLSRLRLTRLLLEGGAYINESNEHGETPLMVACKTHHTDSQSVPKHKIVRYLLENGADPNIQDKTGKTALMHACLEQAGAEILSLLLSNGADPTLEDHAGLSALVHALNSGNREVLRVLLDACKGKGKEVIIITTNKMPTGHQVTKQYLNVPPPPDTEERLNYSPASSHQHPSPICVPVVDKRVSLHWLHSEQWTKNPPTLLQQSQTSSLTGEPEELTPEEGRPFGIGSSAIHGRPPAVSRHHSVDIKDIAGLLKALESRSENKGGGGRRGLGRKMSYDSAASSLHSASHPNLHQDSLPFPYESRQVDEDSSDCPTQLNVSSLQNVVRRRNIGMNHYSSDSQLPQFGCRANSSKSSGGVGVGTERHKLVNSKSCALSGSRESLESAVQRCETARLEQRGSGGYLLDHIAHTRPRYLPPLNPHAPIPDIGASSTSKPLTGSSKTLNSVLTGSKPFLPCAPVFPKNAQANRMLWRRHSMQSEQIKQLANFEETLGH